MQKKLLTIVAVGFVVVVFACTRPTGTRVAAQDAEAYAGMARMYAWGADYDTAVGIYKRLGHRRGTARFASLGIAGVLFQRGEFGAAADRYRALLEDNESDPLVLYNLGLSLQRQGRPEAAKLYFDRFVSGYGALFPVLASQCDAAAAARTP